MLTLVAQEAKRRGPWPPPLRPLRGAPWLARQSRWTGEIMPLKTYVRPRLVILGPEASALDAARAIESNNIGAVVVQDRGQVVGIVTDRDLAVQVVGHGLDAAATPLSDIMTTPVASLSPKDAHTDAIALMQSGNVRRIPLVDDSGRAVGIVTLDDLL